MKTRQRDETGTTQGFWSLVTREAADASVAPPSAMVQRFVDLLSPAFAQEVLRPAATRLKRELVDPAAAEKNLLYNRFLRHAQLRWVKAIGEAGFDVVYLKGFANAHSLYDDPDARTIGDLDFLIRPDALDPLIRFLSGRGFRFDGAPRSPWGFISDTSFLPFVSEDGSANLDLHIAPDAYPADRSLTTEAVFADSGWVDVEGMRLRIPSPEHGFLLALTNAAKVAFGPMSVRKTVDAIRLLERTQALAWDTVGRLADKGRFLKPARVFLNLLRRLGVRLDGVPEGLLMPPRGLASGAFERLVSDYAALFPVTPGTLETLRRELLLGTESRVGLYRNWLRLRGLVRPYGGHPPGTRLASRS
ncbi:MAG: nucleotidyltransferase family protein [Alphaproteobacteria bacterium]|nr:nucleotidyltransferase family protein [Alphaproteobacteria bacterium]